MSDIHVLDGRFNDNGAGFLNIIYHVPNTETNYPGATSEIAGLAQSEIDGLANGTLIEVKKALKINKDIGLVGIRNKIRAFWRTVATKEQTTITSNYRFYGEILARSA